MREYGRMGSKTTSVAERRWLRVLSTLNEAQARLYVAEKAIELGRGGISRLSELTGMSRPTIYKGAAELRARGHVLAAQAGWMAEHADGCIPKAILKVEINRIRPIYFGMTLRQWC